MGKWGKRGDMLVHQAEPYNAEPPPAALDGREITPLDTFYGRNHGPIPRIDPQRWRLVVDGLVRQPLTLSLAELRERFEERTLVATLECAGNRRGELVAVRPIPGQEPWGPAAISTARWTGVSLADVLAEAGPQPDAAHVAFAAPDVSPLAKPAQPFGASIPTGKAMAGEVLLAWGMNGEPLPAAHGAPVRVVVPGYIGARSVKWVERVTLREQPSDNYFQAKAYRLLPTGAGRDDVPAGVGLPLGVLALNAAVLHPAGGQTLPAGPAKISGYAVAGEARSVARVDVSIDGGATWRPADLGPDGGPWAWRLWHASVDLPSGPVEIMARAWDDSGLVQPERAETLWSPDGYVNNAWSRVRVVAQPK